MDPISYVAGIATGIGGLILIMAVVVPDKPAQRAAAWVVTRKNVPTMLLPFAIPAALAGLFGLGIAFIEAFKGLQVAPWVWIALFAGSAVIGINVAVRARVKKTAAAKKAAAEVKKTKSK
ncbi:hypothetical protein KKB64_02025 [Patescibacteria group bacterium]|nr:hypothetical protein [Patescibacteria group bacterium]MBU1472548.1 hypothetical protein [Patescibacteria group bacterium]MBU2460078.1 hypothetical protein [Patescibacteria group bacterium]MBU2544647.1 hypothetical protein [Patescibacteria group bacterium]